MAFVFPSAAFSAEYSSPAVTYFGAHHLSMLRCVPHALLAARYFLGSGLRVMWAKRETRSYFVRKNVGR